MNKLCIISVLLCMITGIVHADKNCQYPASEDFIYHLRPYVEEGNVAGISQLTVQLGALKKSKNIFDLDGCTQKYVDRVYQNIVDKRDEKSLKLIAPFMLEYGHGFLEAPINAVSKRRLVRARWEVDIASQAPGVMITEIKKNRAHKIARAWPLLPRVTQKRIHEEAKKHYDDNCGEVYSDDCYEFNQKLAFIDSLDYAFRKICKIMPQELKDQADAKQAAMEEQIGVYEAAHAMQTKTVENAAVAEAGDNNPAISVPASTEAPTSEVPAGDFTLSDE